MVREVETYNSTEVLEPGLALDFETYPEIITASLSNLGLTLSLMVNRSLAAGYARKVSVNYMLPIYEQQTVAEYSLATFEPDELNNETTVYPVDLSPVMQTIIHNAPEQLPDDTVNVRLYTYESNMPFNYGTCYPMWSDIQAYVVGDYVQYGGRLWQCNTNNVGQLPTVPQYWTPSGVPSSGTITFNLPFTVSYPGQAIMPPSTDGWYAVRVLDVAVYDDNDPYVIGDIVLYSSGLFRCIQNTAGGNDPTDITFWTALTTEEESNLYQFQTVSGYNVPTILNTNLLITRYIKQKHIYELLIRSNYKKYDDIVVVSQLEKIMAMREAAIALLRANNPVAARYMLDQITIEINSFTVNNGEKRVVQTITTFTI